MLFVGFWGLGRPRGVTAEDQRARYSAALELAKHDYEMAWLVFGSVFVGQTVLLGFVGFALSASTVPSRWLLVATAVFGGLLWLPWFTSFQRNAANHAFRVHQAAAMEPAGWNILRGGGRNHADGRQVVIRHPDGTEECFQMPRRGRWRTRSAITFLQLVVLAAYVAIAGSALIGWIGK
jgi:hypothetical protein